MSKRIKGIISIIAIMIADILIIGFTASGRYVNYMPTIGEGKTAVDKFIELYSGKDFISVVLSFISTVILYISYKFIVKDKKSFVLYIVFFITMTVINMAIYSHFIGIAY